MEEIDFVIPWVNSNDPVWQEKRNTLLVGHSEESVENIGEERFRDYGTLKFLIRSIEKYANWVHKIYLITDNQIPEWFLVNEQYVEKSSDKKLVIIDHQEIITKKFLPTFNSNVIELNVLNIEGLADHFVMFNDDLLINDYVKPNDFFYNNLPRDNRIYVPFSPYSDYDHILFNNNKLINRWLKGRYKSKKGLFSIRYGRHLIKNFYHYYFERGHRVSNYSLPHNAQSFLKSTFKTSIDKWDHQVESTMHHPFRSNDDVSILLARNYQLETGQFIPRSPKFSQYYRLNELSKIEADLKKKTHKLLCINDAVVDDYVQNATYINQILEKYLPEKSSFEK